METPQNWFSSVFDGADYTPNTSVIIYTWFQNAVSYYPGNCDVYFRLLHFSEINELVTQALKQISIIPISDITFNVIYSKPVISPVKSFEILFSGKH